MNLRPIEREDLPTLKEWMNDRETTRLLGGARFPPSIAEEERWYAEVLDNKEGRIFAIATKDGVLIGDVGFRHMGGRAHNGFNIFAARGRHQGDAGFVNNPA